jgi:hypothetical protein
MLSAGGAIVTLKDFVDMPPAESETRAVNENVPAVLGVPESTPAELIETPTGRSPDSFDQVYGGVPPAPISDAE